MYDASSKTTNAMKANWPMGIAGAHRAYIQKNAGGKHKQFHHQRSGN